jgi:hypothetical protein
MVFLAIRKAKIKRQNPTTTQEGPRPGKKPRYEFRLCIVGEKHRWIKTTGYDMSFTFTDPSPPPASTPMAGLFDGAPTDSYDIDPTVLYELDPNWAQKIGMLLGGISTSFIVVFNEGNRAPVPYVAPKRSAYVLKTIEESTALSKALREEFAGEFSVKKMFMYLVIIIVGVLAYMILTGQINM